MGIFSKLFSRPEAPDTGLGVDELARRLKLTEAALRSTPVQYQEVRLPKRTGGMRTLHAPLPPLKALQRTLLRRIFGRLATHPAAMGFQRGQSIATNALPHAGATLLVQMDIRDFFTATTDKRVHDYCTSIGWSRAAADLLVTLTTHNHGLPQGAPTSPILSNLLNHRLDQRLFNFGISIGATYTRYADDMTFSLRFDPRKAAVQPRNPRTLAPTLHDFGTEAERTLVASIIRVTQEVVAEYGYHLHTKKKLRIRRRHDRMLVTGVVVNQTLNLPRETRRRLRAVRHHLKTSRSATLSPAQLAGWEALEAMIVAQRPAPGP